MTRTRTLSTLLGTGLALLSLAPAATAAAAHSTVSPTALLAAMNHVRSQHGLAPVGLTSGLEHAAQAHSSDMLARDYFLHETGPGGSSFKQRVSQYWHPAHAAIGEILAWGAGSYATPQAAVQGWLHSATHRAILLSPGYTLAGIGVAHGRFLGHGGAAVWTVDFGRM